MIFECEFGIVVAFVNIAKPCNSRRSSTLVLISTVGENKQNLSCPIPGFIANTPSKSPSRQTTLLPFLRLIMVIESLKLFKIVSPGFRWLQFPEFVLSQSQCLRMIGSCWHHLSVQRQDMGSRWSMEVARVMGVSAVQVSHTCWRDQSAEKSELWSVLEVELVRPAGKTW